MTIQLRFDDTSGLARIHIKDLIPHPASVNIYGNEDIAWLVEEIGKSGWIKPLKVNDKNVIISGHSRWKAAQMLGITVIDAFIVHYDTEEAELEELLLENLYRIKTTEQRVREAEQWKAIERARAKARQATNTGGSNPQLQVNLPEAERGQSREAIATRVGIGSGSTYERAAKVVQAIDDAAARGDEKTAVGLKTVLNESVDGATKLLKTSEEIRTRALEKIASGEEKKATRAIQAAKREEVKEHLETVAAQEVEQSTGLYDVLVIDPPWPTQKIERDERPNQVIMDYPTLDVWCQEIEIGGSFGGEDAYRATCLVHEDVDFDLDDDGGRINERPHLCASIECQVGDIVTHHTADDCHVWIWSTQKYLPAALSLLETWDLTYVCTFVWHKPGGFQVARLPQYNCEFAIYARKGSPMFLDTKAFFTCFEAPRGAHSEKPQAFYDTVRQVTAGRRLDLFNRRFIDGFTGWGQEATRGLEER